MRYLIPRSRICTDFEALILYKYSPSNLPSYSYIDSAESQEQSVNNRIFFYPAQSVHVIYPRFLIYINAPFRLHLYHKSLYIILRFHRRFFILSFHLIPEIQDHFVLHDQLVFFGIAVEPDIRLQIPHRFVCGRRAG